jgi:hypothetical protein
MSAGLDRNAGGLAAALRPPAVPSIAVTRAAGLRRRLAGLRLEQFVMGAAVVALCVLVVLPLVSLFVSSVWGEDGPTFAHFAEALSSRLYLQPLYNSLVLGAWTGLFSIVIGVPLAWAGSRTNVPGKGLIRITAYLSYLSPPFLTAIAFVNLFSPNAGLVNAFLRDPARRRQDRPRRPGGKHKRSGRDGHVSSPASRRRGRGIQNGFGSAAHNASLRGTIFLC